MKASLQKSASHARPRQSKTGNGSFFHGQPRLKTGRPGDKFEREADRMADRVVSNQTQGALASEVSPVRGLDLERQPMDREEKEPVQRVEAESEQSQFATDPEEDNVQLQNEQSVEELGQHQEEESGSEEEIQRAEKDDEGQSQSETAEPGPPEDEPVEQSRGDEQELGQSRSAIDSPMPVPRLDVAAMLRQKRGQGSPLPETIRSKMEQRFSADFTGVRIHRDEVQLTQLLGAQAFTSGSDIFFNRNRYNPAIRAGEHLLAHELTHTVQQGASRPVIVPLGRPASAPVSQNKDEEQLQTQQDDDEDVESYLIRPELVDAILLARSQAGLVDANLKNADGTRIGNERLLEYFRTAFGGREVVHPEVIKRKRLMSLPKHGTNEREMRDAMPSWCGIFVWWALKKAGVPIPDWKLGVSQFRQFRIRGPRELPQKGDIAHASDNAHWALVTGVESVSKAEGKPFQNIMVRTMNGNTAGSNTRGGQIQELWHPISRWIGFLDPVARLSMPEVDLVRVGREPDPDEGLPEIKQQKHDIPGTDADKIKEVTDTGPELPGEDTAAVSIQLPPPVEMGSPEEVAEIPELDLSGSSDQAMVKYTDSSPSQMAARLPSLGTSITEKAESEKQDQSKNPPVLTARTSGKVKGGITPPSQLAVPSDPSINDTDTDNIEDFKANPHKDHAAPPSTATTREKLNKQPRESLLNWLKKNILNVISEIRTNDRGVNTSAGARQKVRLSGQADPGRRIGEQRRDADSQVKGRRDEVTENLKSHPGQTNIQAKAVKVENRVAVSIEPGIPAVTEGNEDASDYVAAPLPQDVRDGADAEIAKTLHPNIAGARRDAQSAADTRDMERNQEIDKARTDTSKINTDADNEQRRVVLDGRTDVARQQKEGIKKAYGEVDAFHKESDDQHREVNKNIKKTTTDAEKESHKCLTNAEDEAKRRKIAAEKKAADEKKRLEEENKKKSWWDKGIDAVKGLVNRITAFIDKVFTALREGIATLINAAKEAAIGLINLARNAVVGLLDGFRKWAKEKVNTYLKKRFPELAAAINKGIDATVDSAIDGVNKAADLAIKGVEAIAGVLGKILDKILQVFQTVLKAVVEIAGAVITGDLSGALKAALRAACDIAGIDSKPIFDFIDRAGKQIKVILKNPKTFFNGLMKAVGSGVNSFVKNIKDHLVGGLIGWLTGALSEVAITLPEKFDAPGIFSLGMQILGLTYESIKARVIKRFPPAEKIFGTIEKGVEIIKKIREGGIAALWGEVKNAIGNFKEMVLGAIRGFVITTVVEEAVVWLLSLLNPAAAIVKLVKLLFDFVMFLVERFQQIKTFVMSIYNTIADAVSGNFAKVATGVEDAMARSLPVVISLLARLAGLGGIGKTVKQLIGKVSKPINKVIDKIINRIIKFAGKVLKKGKKTAKKMAAKFAKWWVVKRKFKAEDGKEHSLFFKGKGASATLTVRSDEQSYVQFLSWAIKKKDIDKAAAKKARNIASKIDAEKARKLKGKNDTEKDKDSKKKKAEVENLIGQLQQHTGKLFGKNLPESEVEWGSLTSAGFGSSMKAKILTTERNKDSRLKGSPPSQASQSTYDQLNLRRQRGGASYYIRGHLLNDNVGGPGKWFNMTPLSRRGNKLHESKAESTVKAGVNSGAIIEYNVIPKYGSRPNSGTIVSQAGKGLSKNDKQDLKAIVKSEKYVPTGLTIKISTKEKKNGSFKVVKTQSPSVDNPIERAPESYFLSGGGKKIQPVDVNNISSSKPLENSDISDNLRKNANAIWAAIKVRKDVPDHPMYGSYETLSDKSGVPISKEDQEYLVLRPRA